MLKTSIDHYLQLRRALGFQLQAEESILHSFARWASQRGEQHVRSQMVTEWAATARSPWQRERRLRTVAAFARHARAEDPRHEVPPTSVFARRHQRPKPYIYSPQELRRLLEAAARLPSTWPLRPQIFTTLFGLLASTGLRISEALALRVGDVTRDGLVIHKTKFNKTRLVPLHPTCSAALQDYLHQRRDLAVGSDYVLLSPKGKKLPYSTVRNEFLCLTRQIGIRFAAGTPGPRIHHLRHTFAVRALEASPQDARSIGWHMRALSTYLGHVNVSDTCWYLHATPHLMRGMADQCEQFFNRGAP